jgi:kinesin family protein 22
MAPPAAKRPRASIAPRNAILGMTSAAGPSRVPRVSAAFHMNGAAPYPSAGKRRESGFGTIQERFNANKKITDQDIDDKVRFLAFDRNITYVNIFQISKAVEAEVERRLKEKLEEMERQRAADEERSRQEVEIADTTRDQTFDMGRPGLPSGLLTPLLKRHQDLDNELRQRLQELEKK